MCHSVGTPPLNPVESEAMTVIIASDFNPVPSHGALTEVVCLSEPSSPDAQPGVVRAIAVASEGPLPESLLLSREQLALIGFEAKVASTLLLPEPNGPVVLVGTGDKPVTPAVARDLAAAVARAAAKHSAVEFDLRQLGKIDPEEAAAAVTEGAVLARYRYDTLKAEPKTVALTRVNLVTSKSHVHDAERGADRGRELARATNLARDLANTPPRHLTAEKFANVIIQLAPEFGLSVEVFDREQLMALGCGGLLGVNAGSVEEPRMVVLSYQPAGASTHLALVGKGIMYDSGGISLKPGNAMHTQMKLDMAGAAAVFAAMSTLRVRGVSAQVTGFLMCTDNMPSGSATKLGDVLTIRGGKTVEVKNTDAEGRLVLADGLVLATEKQPDAIVDIATLTGNALAALGPQNAAVFANNSELLEQVQRAAEISGESIWQMPLDHRYREGLNSEIADLQNIGGEYAGSITAALFLHEFVGTTPWAHLDIAATMRSEKDDLWRSVGATGFGTRLLANLAAAFAKPPVA